MQFAFSQLMDWITQLTLLAQDSTKPLPPNPLRQVDGFLGSGGVFMVFILICSIVAVTVCIARFLALRKAAVMPSEITYYIHRLESGRSEPEDLGRLGAVAAKGDSPLAFIIAAAFGLKDEDTDTMRSGVEATAREQVVGLQRGMGVLEVVITIAPLLGLLGTVSGLVGVFGVIGDAGGQNLSDANYGQMAKGIAEALSTTIAGLAVTVPVVIAHSYLNKKIEIMAARMEVMAGAVIKVLRAKSKEPVAPQLKEDAFQPPAGAKQKPPRHDLDFGA